MTDHIRDTSAASRPESANLLTHPLREAVAEALMVAYDECWSSMAGAFSVRHAERLADAALAVVRAAIPEPANGDGLNEYRDALWEWLS